MFIYCPSCQKTEDIDPDAEPDVLICSQCDSDISIPTEESEHTAQKPHWEHASNLFASPPLLSNIDSSEGRENDPADEQIDEPLELAAPTREKAHLWPWFFSALLIMTVVGIWTQKEVWLDNRWMRSSLINLSLPLENRAKDWLILPQSVQTRWVTRDDKSRVMVVSGSIRNLLTASMPYPGIEITFFSKNQPDIALGERVLPLTDKPDLKAISQSPFVAAKALKIAKQRSETEFVMVIESVPEGTGDFTLSPRVD